MKIKVGISSKIQGLHFLVVGADELDAVGCGLNIRDAVMEKIFVLDSSETSSGGGESSGRSTEQGAGQSGSGPAEKEEGEVGEAGEDVGCGRGVPAEDDHEAVRVEAVEEIGLKLTREATRGPA